MTKDQVLHSILITILFGFGAVCTAQYMSDHIEKNRIRRVERTLAYARLGEFLSHPKKLVC